MLKDGTYAAWFRTSLGEGTGIVHFADGKLWGRDSIMLYSGTYDVDGDRFSAVVTARRHTEGHATVFGTDDLVLRLKGVSNGAIATCSGTADAAPDLVFEATLIPSHDVPAVSDADQPARKFDASKLPKLPSRSSR
ncbi:hypothetical protein AS156_12385 [Bradyrhizobium macuxiense]|uniref:Type III secretion system (T3SS) negative regulator GrlR n=1 Tax=Bradyrhizobium macuxiense TaxID=1755647 RepID=A0A120FKY2_9BRAD|nr:hypothetical protein [Bradyrhizobium macuxiense]KWV51381.1 hypothetical protein AS156_12385 [Bradyrhizobium macuxiense]